MPIRDDVLRGSVPRLGTIEDLDRFESKVIDLPNGCRLWTAATTKEGYGRFWFDGSTSAAHRWIYEALVEPIPDEDAEGNPLTLDHLCEVQPCVNVRHLEVVTMRENLMRGHTPAGLNAHKTHCPRGHPYSGDNLCVKRDGRRSCRACARAYYHRHKGGT